MKSMAADRFGSRSQQRAGDNPWGVGATALEWTLSSPPPFRQFERLPLIK
jgi:cytochrome c oxidase subunit I